MICFFLDGRARVADLPRQRLCVRIGLDVEFAGCQGEKALVRRQGSAPPPDSLVGTHEQAQARLVVRFHAHQAFGERKQLVETPRVQEPATGAVQEVDMPQIERLTVDQQPVVVHTL